MKCRYHTNYETPVSAGGWCTKFEMLCDSPGEEPAVDECGYLREQEAED